MPSAEVGPAAAPKRIAWKELAGELRASVLSGKFPPDSRLPTEAELMKTHGISRQTIRQAFSELVAERLVYRVRGKGTYATPARGRSAYLRSFGSIEDLLALSLDTELETIRPLQRGTDIDAAGRLQQDTDDVYTTLFLRLHQELPFCVTAVLLPLTVGDDVIGAGAAWAPGERARTTIIALIDLSQHGPIAVAHQSITAVAVPPELARLLACEEGLPVMRVDRLYFNRAGTPVELAVSHFNPARYSYRLELRR